MVNTGNIWFIMRPDISGFIPILCGYQINFNLFKCYNKIMKRGRSSCLCGYEGRVDTVTEHKKKCKAYPIIEGLQEEVKSLRAEIEFLKKYQGNVTNINNYHNNINNITIYGTESLPDALKELKQLCKSGDFEYVVPRYIEMKHFNEGVGNIRIQNDRLQVYNEGGWVDMDKNDELARLTSNNAEEVIDRYGNTTPTSYFKTWHDRLDMNSNKNSNEFKNVQKKVEEVIKNNSE